MNETAKTEDRNQIYISGHDFPFTLKLVLVVSNNISHVMKVRLVIDQNK